jgi:hypothetical protein
MNFLDGGFAAAAVAIADLIRDHGADLPAVTYEALAAYYASPVDRLVTSCEALYAVGRRPARGGAGALRPARPHRRMAASTTSANPTGPEGDRRHAPPAGRAGRGRRPAGRRPGAAGPVRDPPPPACTTAP